VLHYVETHNLTCMLHHHGWFLWSQNRLFTKEH